MHQILACWWCKYQQLFIRSWRRIWMNPERCLRLFVTYLTYVRNWKVAHWIMPRLIQMIGSLICHNWTTLLRRLAMILRRHKNSRQCISWIICAINIKIRIWRLKIKWVNLMNRKNYKTQSRIIGRLIIVIYRMMMKAMMKKVKTRRINIMYLM